MGQLVAGLFLAIPFLKHSIFTENTAVILETLAAVGAIFLMLLTGMEVDREKMEKNFKDAFAIAFFAALVPLFGGIVLGRYLEYSWITSFVLGAGLAITASGTKASILMEMRKIKTRIGGLMLGAGIIDDIIGIVLISGIILLAKNGDLLGSLITFPPRIICFLGISFLCYKYFPHYFAKFEKKHSEVVIFNLTIIIALIFALFSELMGLGTVLGAFLAGIILQKSFELKSHVLREEKDLKIVLFGFIIPFFFIFVSINFDYASVIQNPKLTLFLLAVAISGKIIGTLISKPFTHLSWKQLYLIGWGMNSRGVMELIIAEIARANGLISNELFSAIVIMAITTTLIFPVILKRMIRANPKIMK